MSVNCLAEHGLVLVAAIQVERDDMGRPVEFMPQDRYDNLRDLSLNPHGAGPFCRFLLPRLPATSGVYAVGVGEAVVYVGECQNLAERFGPRGYGVIHPRNCFRGGQPTNCKVNAHVLDAHRRGVAPDLYFEPERPEGRKRTEVDLIAALRPPWNTRVGSP